jgi:hypothetical protein
MSIIKGDNMVRVNVSNSGIESISSPRTSYSPKVSNRFQPLSGSQSAKIVTAAAKPGLQRAQSWPTLKVSFDLSENAVVPFEVSKAMKPTNPAKAGVAPTTATAAGPASPKAPPNTPKSPSPKAVVPAPATASTKAASPKAAATTVATTASAKVAKPKVEKESSWSWSGVFMAALIVSSAAIGILTRDTRPVFGPEEAPYRPPQDPKQCYPFEAPSESAHVPVPRVVTNQYAPSMPVQPTGPSHYYPYQAG